jgi:hypothetical protein
MNVSYGTVHEVAENNLSKLISSESIGKDGKKRPRKYKPRKPKPPLFRYVAGLIIAAVNLWASIEIIGQAWREMQEGS